MSSPGSASGVPQILVNACCCLPCSCVVGPRWRRSDSVSYPARLREKCRDRALLEVLGSRTASQDSPSKTGRNARFLRVCSSAHSLTHGQWEPSTQRVKEGLRRGPRTPRPGGCRAPPGPGRPAPADPPNRAFGGTCERGPGPRAPDPRPSAKSGNETRICSVSTCCRSTVHGSCTVWRWSSRASPPPARHREQSAQGAEHWSTLTLSRRASALACVGAGRRTPHR